MNPYPTRFLELLDATDGPVLDSGSGGRRHPRIVSLECVAHPNNSVHGDGQALPFRDDTFALCLSQATLEHVPDPQAYVDELARVTRPGGLLWIEAAFCQPLHQAPWHFFNITGFGLAHLVRELEVVEAGCFGLLAEWWEWVADELGAKAILGYRAEQVGEAMRLLDETMSPDRLAVVAPAVFVLARVP